MQIPQEIIDNHNLKPYKENWLKGVIELPFGKFYHYFRKPVNTKFVFRFTVKNFNDESTIDKLIENIEENIAEVDNRSLTKVDNLNLEKFDRIIFVPYEFTILPKSNFPEFDMLQIQAIPICNFEMSGNESPKESQQILRTSLIPPDWNRDPQPKAKYKFKNIKEKYGTVGEGLVVDKEQNVYSALAKFKDGESEMIVENYLGMQQKIEFDSKLKKIVLNNGTESLVGLKDVEHYLSDFFRKSK